MHFQVHLLQNQVQTSSLTFFFFNPCSKHALAWMPYQNERQNLASRRNLTIFHEQNFLSFLLAFFLPFLLLSSFFFLVLPCFFFHGAPFSCFLMAWPKLGEERGERDVGFAQNNRHKSEFQSPSHHIWLLCLPCMFSCLDINCTNYSLNKQLFQWSFLSPLAGPHSIGR